MLKLTEIIFLLFSPQVYVDNEDIASSDHSHSKVSANPRQNYNINISVHDEAHQTGRQSLATVNTVSDLDSGLVGSLFQTLNLKNKNLFLVDDPSCNNQYNFCSVVIGPVSNQRISSCKSLFTFDHATKYLPTAGASQKKSFSLQKFRATESLSSSSDSISAPLLGIE